MQLKFVILLIIIVMGKLMKDVLLMRMMMDMIIRILEVLEMMAGL